MKIILHPTDFSENAAKALDFAIGIADRYNAVLILLNVTQLPTAMNTSTVMTMYPHMEEEVKASITDRLKKYAAKHMKTKGKMPDIDYMVKVNSSTAKGIAEAIDETSADMVVMGTKGQSKLKDFFLGSTTKVMISKSPCPVLAVPEKAEFNGINHITYASDFNPNDLETIEQTTKIARENDAELSILHISKKSEGINQDAVAFQQWLTEIVKYPKVKFTARVSDDVSGSIVNYLEDHQVDLLVFFEKEKSAIGGLFHKGTVKKFVDHTSTIPVLSYNIYSIDGRNES